VRFKGQVLLVHFKQVDRSLVFVFSQRVDVLAHYEGEPDCRLSLDLSVLPQLKQQDNISALIKQDKIELSGDIQLAQQFAQLLEDCKPDLEEWLSRITGDILAHTLFQGAKNITDWLKNQADKQQHHLAQAITQEWDIAPAPLEIAYFCDQVDATQQQAERLNQKITDLLERL
jgi:ubiquinone biosynthesis protein UbiJ